jgi:hypothetical protein
VARSRAGSVLTDERQALRSIEAWYRKRLTAKAVQPTLDWSPVTIGPTWQTDGDHWVLPDRTLGWGVLAWCGRWLQNGRDEPWRFTDEQARFILWWYATQEDGTFVYRDGVLQRLKGWGKDPINACLSVAEMLGPVRVGDVVKGQPVGTDVPEAWVQAAAVSLEQTKNTMRLLPGLVTAEAREVFGFSSGKETANAMGDTRFLQAVTSSPTTLEGARGTFVSANETHHWLASNGGHEMAAVIERNATKSADGAARTLRITNAYEPGRDSVAEQDRDAYNLVAAGLSAPAGLLYDSLEAPPEAPLSLEAAPGVIRSIRGDSTWLNVDRIVQSIADARNPPSRSRRFWYNQIVAAEDAWLGVQAWDALGSREQLADDEQIVAFFDGSKSDDATGLVACRVSDGKVFQLGVWQRPAGWDAKRMGPWTVNREDVDRVVEETFARFRVLGLWADPSHAKDDDAERYWDALIDKWHREHSRTLKLWSLKTGMRQHSVLWDMAGPAHQAEFTAAAERFAGDVEAGNLTHDASPALALHVHNARRWPNRYGISLGKSHRESPHKIDLAVCAVGARMLWRLWLNQQHTGVHLPTRVIVLD